MKDENTDVQKAAINNVNAPLELLTEMAKQENEDIRALVASSTFGIR